MLNKKQKECIKLMVCGELSQREIAQVIKTTEQTICAWKKDEEFQAEYDALMRDEIKTLAPKARRTMDKLLAAKSEMVRFSAAKDILDRAGYAEDTKLNITGGPVQIIDDIPRGNNNGET